MRQFQITSGPAVGAVFEVEDEATEEEIAEAAFNCAVEFLDYGWEEVTGDGRKPVRPGC